MLRSLVGSEMCIRDRLLFINTTFSNEAMPRNLTTNPSSLEDAIGNALDRFPLTKYNRERQKVIAQISPMFFIAMLGEVAHYGGQKMKHPISMAAIRIAMTANPVYAKIRHYNNLPAVRKNLPKKLLKLRELEKVHGKKMLGP